MDKEKEVIEYLKTRIYLNEGYKYIEVERESLISIINLINKLQKQIDLEFVEENFIEKSKVISKNKIRDKIKELEKEYNNCKRDDTFKKAKLLYQIAILKELLEDK